MSVDNAGHPQVDFVWGNVPMQPNDERGANLLDPILDGHEIVYNSWNGYPQYVPNTVDGSGAGSGSGSGSAAVTAVYGPTTNWIYSPMQGYLYFSGGQALPMEVTMSPTSYKLVLVNGTYAGEYPLLYAGQDMMMGTPYVGFSNQLAPGTIDGSTAGTATIVLI